MTSSAMGDDDITGPRAWIKHRVYGWDDALIALGTVLHLAQSIAVWLGLSHGLAKSNTITAPADGAAASKAWFAAEILGLVVLGLSKCSVLALMLRVFTPETGITSGYRACLLLTIASTLWCIASVIGISANCNSMAILTPESKELCPGLYDRMLGITIPDIITDVLICSIPLFVTLPLNMTKGVRFHVSLAFSFRLFVVPLAALRLYYFGDAVADDADDTQLVITNSLLFQQAALVVSLVSATIPNLRTFMKSLNTGFHLPPLAVEETRGFALRTFGGSTMINGHSNGSNAGRSNTGNASRKGKSPAVSRSSQNRDEAQEELSLRPDGVHHEARISHVRCPSDAVSEQPSHRSGSQERIITKRVEWNIRHDTG
ncbi:hypothetical protein PG997_007220 [Apiospora hydei]|uniref:Rhodopsin domain-containing protein n=1 Tax=Apiospora hydei TaxID=1337664 RepID=A0ABR1W8M7_9PEZI